MVTPATTASSVSAPARIISSARSQARRPFALEITTSLPEDDCAAAADIAAEVRNQFLRVSMRLLWREEAPRRNAAACREAASGRGSAAKEADRRARFQRTQKWRVRERAAGSREFHHLGKLWSEH